MQASTCRTASTETLVSLGTLFLPAPAHTLPTSRSARLARLQCVVHTLARAIAGMSSAVQRSCTPELQQLIYRGTRSLTPPGEAWHVRAQCTCCGGMCDPAQPWALAPLRHSARGSRQGLSQLRNRSLSRQPGRTRRWPMRRSLRPLPEQRRAWLEQRTAESEAARNHQCDV